MSDEARAKLDAMRALAEQIVALPDADRSLLWDILKDTLCTGCGEQERGRCWTCYPSVCDD